MYTWKRYGGYEVSSHGDKRFSAFNALMPDGRSIEMHYQCDVKGYDVGGTNWRLGKGKPPLKRVSKEYIWDAYMELWWIWSDNHPELMDELKECADKYGGILSDKFATTDINQARALATILNQQ